MFYRYLVNLTCRMTVTLQHMCLHVLIVDTTIYNLPIRKPCYLKMNDIRAVVKVGLTVGNTNTPASTHLNVDCLHLGYRNSNIYIKTMIEMGHNTIK